MASQFGFYPGERVAVFIDGPNLYSATKTLGFDVDFKRLHAFFAEEARLHRIHYYTAVREAEEYNSLKPLLDWLQYNGFHLVTKPTKEFVDSAGRTKIKGNLDVEITVDMLESAGHVDHIVLLSGDGDFRYVVEAVQRKGAKVTVVSSLNAGMVADELRRQADQFLDLTQIQEAISRSDRSPLKLRPRA